MHIHLDKKQLAAVQNSGTESKLKLVRRLEGSEFRVLGRFDQLSPVRVGCSRYELGCAAGTATAMLHHDCFSPTQREAQFGEIVQVWGDLYENGGGHLIAVQRFACLSMDVPASVVALLPRDWVLPTFVPQLKTVISSWISVSTPALQRFLSDAFRDSNIAMGFLNAPASQRYHHAYPGGLLDHSADMLERFEKGAPGNWNSSQRDLTVCLILLHDIGKTVTLVGKSRADRGYYQPHEFAALELLAAPLARLEVNAPQLANHIRGFFKPKNWYPRNFDPIYRLVSAIDRKSAGYPRDI